MHKVRQATKIGGKVFMADSQVTIKLRSKDQTERDLDDIMQKRLLNDGTQYKIVNIYYSADELTAIFERHGFEIDVKPTDEYIIYATATRID